MKYNEAQEILDKLIVLADKIDDAFLRVENAGYYFAKGMEDYKEAKGR
jgi:hypothetical protein